MPVIEDEEFGRIVVRRTQSGRAVRFGVAPNGSLRISSPRLTPLFMVRRMIAGSRMDLRKLLLSQQGIALNEGGSIGKRHTLERRNSDAVSVRRSGVRIIVSMPQSSSMSDRDVLQAVRPYLLSALRKEAKEYLPKRLSSLAAEHGFQYTAVRFSHASGRWGSCNSKGSISLNIALMNIPYDLIDYVLVHELAHTMELNHSPSFWSHVERCIPTYAVARKSLKDYSPHI